MRIRAFAILLLVPFATVAEAQYAKRDSVEARRKASGAQARFEIVRRANLPRSNAGSNGQCDARIGRFCQWNNDDDTVEAKQPRVIKRAREALVASLDSQAKKSPRDGWITGQRVRYLIEARNDTAALRVARECQAVEWWCAALEGLALHENGDGVGADSAFSRALRTMPAAERCKWTDMTPLLDPALRSRFKKVGCGKNEKVAERLWWLADPFWSLEGNERRNEHYARHTMAKIEEPARNTFNMSWSSDLREMIVRYGWARYWTREPGTYAEPQNGPISGHEATPNYHFVPVSLSADTMATSFKFDLDLNSSSERYSPVMARRVFEIEPQVALFRRGDSTRVVVAYDVNGRKNLDSMSFAGGLALAPDEKTPPTLSADSAGRKGALSAVVESKPHVMSLEVIDSVHRRGAAWKRLVLNMRPRRPEEIALSDPLLFEPTDSTVGDLETAMKVALGSNVVKRGKVGIYWETYGLSQSDSTQPVSLTLTRIQVGALRRLGEQIGLASRMSPLKIQWNQVNGSTIAYRAVVLDLSLIPAGKYELTIQTTSAVNTRTIELR
jgi:hypothetical protein